MSEVDVLDTEICQTCTCRFNKYYKTFITASFRVLFVALYYQANLTQLTFPSKCKNIYELKKFYEIDLLASLFSLNFGKTLSSMFLIKLHFSCFLFLKAHIQQVKVVNVQTLHTMEGELLTSHGSIVLCNYITGQKAYYDIKFTYDLHLLCPCSTAWL